jgi:DeoR/GlpR family transcriptional regulator of sugar metabolism
MAICSCKGLDAEVGVTDSNERDSAVKTAMFQSAKKRVLAVDSTKFDRASFVKVCDLSFVDTVVTDTEPDQVWLNRFADNNVEILY